MAQMQIVVDVDRFMSQALDAMTRAVLAAQWGVAITMCADDFECPSDVATDDLPYTIERIGDLPCPLEVAKAALAHVK